MNYFRKKIKKKNFFAYLNNLQNMNKNKKGIINFE